MNKSKSLHKKVFKDKDKEYREDSESPEETDTYYCSDCGDDMGIMTEYQYRHLEDGLCRECQRKQRGY